MKLSYEAKLEIYQLRQAGFSWPYISRSTVYVYPILSTWYGL